MDIELKQSPYMTSTEAMREKWIDNAKGIAILLVMLAHVNSKWDFAYGFHLVVFFVLSGYTSREQSLSTEYVRKKYQRLMRPYFYTCFAVIVMDVFNCYLVKHDTTIKTVTQTVSSDLIRSFFASGAITQFGAVDLGGRIGAIWFFPALFFSLVLFQIFLNMFNNDSNVGFASFVAAGIGMTSASFIWMPFSIQSGMFAVPFLWIGYEIKKKHLLDRIRGYHYVMGLMILLAGIRMGLCNIGFVAASLNDTILSPIIGLSGALMVYFLAKQYKGAAFSYLGRNSSTILCVHLFALETMGEYFNKILEIAGIPDRWRMFCLTMIHIAFPIMITLIMERVRANKNRFVAKEYRLSDARDGSIDVAKGIFIISMIVGHYAIDSTLRAIIFSCHMIAFIIFSGYFYKKRDLRTSIIRIINNFIKPYLAAVLLFILVSYKSWSKAFLKETVIRYAVGISYTNRILTEIGSVGPICFILLLFVVRMLYLITDTLIKLESGKWAAVLGASIFGVLLGQRGYWLPWSFDIACYCLLFYKIGIFAKDHSILKQLKNMPALYFVLVLVWAYMIYSGSMEIAIRNYGKYGLVIVGAVAGTAVVYMLSNYLYNNTKVLGTILAAVGKSSLYVLIIHTIIGGIISNVVSQKYDPEYIPYMIITLLLQVIIAVIAYYLTEYVKKTLEKSAQILV